MSGKFLVVILFGVTGALCIPALAGEGPPGTRPAASGDKKPQGKPYGMYNKSGGKFGGTFDPAKARELKEKYGMAGLDPEKLKELKEKYGKEGFPGKGAAPGGFPGKSEKKPSAGSTE